MARIHTKHLVILALAGSLTVAAIAQENKSQMHKSQNLKVLPANISHDSLMTVMHTWENALGVDCAFCHAPSKTVKDRLDFASDENRAKGAARHMYMMTDSINHNYFSWWNPAKESHQFAVSCYTCHHGHKQPEVWTTGAEKENKK